MTREEAMFYIKELQKTYASMDKKVAEAVDMAIEALKENNLSDSLVTDSSDDCKESESKLDLIRREDAIEVLMETIAPPSVTLDTLVMRIDALPSAEPPYKYSDAYVEQIRTERDILQDMVNNMAEPKTGEWIEVEVFPEVYDIEGVKSWGSEMQCDQCGFRFTAIEGHITQYNFCPNCGARMLREDGKA